MLSCGLCWCCCVFVIAGLTAFARFFVCFSMRSCMMCFLFGVCELLCGDACWIMCVAVFLYVFNVFVWFVCGLACDVVWYIGVCFVALCVCVPLLQLCVNALVALYYVMLCGFVCCCVCVLA